MSGIVGIINLDGATVDRQMLQQMTEFMAYRGPDVQDIWVDGNVGFGHALLRTTSESLREQQPCSLDGEVWITADARIDGRAELIEKLNSSIDLKTVTDVELILRAYQVWEEDCVKHLLGDFAFAIWDSRQQRLFCARDHFGVKPFYYARVGNCLVFGNTLNCVRIHPDVSDELNDLAIADFLLFGYNQELDTTTFADIQRLPPAHCLTWSRETLQSKRYWMLPVDGQIRYKKASDYVDRFKELLGVAVEDRLRSDSVGVFMSGGLDSTTIAATAKEALSKQSKAFDLRAYTTVFDRLIPDRERYYSGLAAEALGIPIHYLVADDYTLFERWEQPLLRRPEPTDVSFLAFSVDQFKQIATESRVVLDGNGGDPVLYSRGAYFYFAYLVKNLQLLSLGTELVQYVLSRGRLPQPGLRSQVKRWLGIRSWRPTYPSWIGKELSQSLNLRERWEKLTGESAPIHPIRPEAYEQLTAPLWPYLFESRDPGVTGFPVEVRYPFFDLRLVNYLLAIPPVPWFLHKELVRVAMAGILPESVRLRPKTPLVGDPLRELLQQPRGQWREQFKPTSELAKYVNPDALALISEINSHTSEVWLNLRPLNLDLWLQNLENNQNQIDTGEKLCTQKA